MVKVHLMALYKCLFNDVCDSAIMDDIHEVVVCLDKDITCQYCDVKYINIDKKVVK